MMKAKNAVCFAIIIFNIQSIVLAQNQMRWPGGPKYVPPTPVSPLNNDPKGAGALAEQMQIYEQGYAEQAERDEMTARQQAALRRIYAKGVWRVINGTTNYAIGKGWAQIQGTVLEKRNDGIIFNGSWGPILSIRVGGFPFGGEGKYVLDYSGNDSTPRKFLVKNIPEKCLTYGAFTSDETSPFTGNFLPADYQAVSETMAFYAGNYSTTNSDGDVETIPVFDYGKPCVKIWSPEEIEAAKQQIAAKKKAIADKILKNNQALADKGDAYGLLRMGERYRDGEGVEKDLAKSKDYLTKAAAAGSETAANELSKLNGQ